jgi:hypothetical protein
VAMLMAGVALFASVPVGVTFIFSDFHIAVWCGGM